jgi:hypothetical protein
MRATLANTRLRSITSTLREETESIQLLTVYYRANSVIYNVDILVRRSLLPSIPPESLRRTLPPLQTPYKPAECSNSTPQSLSRVLNRQSRQEQEDRQRRFKFWHTVMIPSPSFAGGILAKCQTLTSRVNVNATGGRLRCVDVVASTEYEHWHKKSKAEVCGLH